MRRGVLTVGACILVLAVSFCCGCTEEPEEITGGELTGPVWLLETYVGVDGAMTAAIAEAPVTAEFVGGSVSGLSGCNRYHAAYLTDGQSLTLDLPVVTLMYCDRADVMNQEAQYLALLGTVAGYTISGDRLTFTDPSGQAILIFRMVDQNLAGTKWELTGYNNGAGGFVSVVTGSSVTAMFGEDGQMSGNAGCNSYSGSYVVSGKSISIGPLAMTEMYCMDPDGVMDQESAYFAAVQAAASYRVGAGELSLVSADGRQMAVFGPYTPNPQGVTWELSGYNNGQGGVVSPRAGTIVTAVFGADGQVTGSAGCNDYLAPYTVSGMEMTIGPVGSTRMYCDSPDGVMEQEARYLVLLGDAGMIDRTPDTLTVRDADGITLLTYTLERANPLAGDWLTVSYRDADGNLVSVLEGTELTAVFGTDWQVTGRAGCNSYFGSYTTDGQKFSVGPLGLSMMYCKSPEGVMEQESGYLTALEDAASYKIRENDLTLYDKESNPCVRYMPAP
ncbi:META domain-containing protein [Methanogenium sp. S4BF]|uniref:META domain-containing protein n=1 Tax=Methanogenium sp. S4BF TaxID=1789226 RepID=UPI002417957E|nr:META domain-containing protein [Methanogenium sp. S4BF]WFN33590.1 META domain-containing protein [Methanogenium sp. S4BF]